MTPETDTELLEAWRAGDRVAGRQLVDRHLPAIGRFFANKVTAEHDAEDLVSATFERLAKALERYRGNASVRTYLFSIAHNVLREYIRDRQRKVGRLDTEVSILDLGPSPSAALARHRDEQRLLHALRALPIAHQIVLELSFFEELSRSEIAEITGLPEGTVASRLRKARELLEGHLTELADSGDRIATDGDLAQWAQRVREALAE